MSSLVSIEDLKRQEILRIFDLARKIKAHPRHFRNGLEGEKIGLIFEKPSTRTRISFEAGIFDLGGGVIYFGAEDMKLGVREEIRDVARVMSRYLSAVVMRTFRHETITRFRDFFDRPVINGLSDLEHPCQALADFFTIREFLPASRGKKKTPLVSFVGDGNNVLNSLLLTAAKLGIHMNYATPAKHEPTAAVLRKVKAIAQESGAQIAGFHDPVKAVQSADAVYTDVWISMGQEKQRQQKIKAFKKMQVNRQLMAHASKKALVLHCLPAHRGEEITNDVLEGPQSIVFDQAENRLHIQKAVLLHLFSKSKGART